MFRLPYLRLPQEFVILLQTNLNTLKNEDSLNTIYKTLSRSNHILALLKKCFKEQNNFSNNSKELISLLGWKNVRDRLASFYLYYQKHKRYPTVSDTELIKDIVELENRLEKYTIDGPSRIFLLLFYTKMASLKIPDNIVNILNLYQSKILYIDWVILILWSLTQILGEKELIKLISKKESYCQIYKKITLEDKKRMTSNFMAYGFATGNTLIFKGRLPTYISDASFLFSEHF